MKRTLKVCEAVYSQLEKRRAALGPHGRKQTFDDVIHDLLRRDRMTHYRLTLTTGVVP